MTDRQQQRTDMLIRDAAKRTLKVGPFDFTIEAWSPGASVGARRYGECSTVEQIIRIGTGYSTPAKVVDTLIHEIGHAIYWVCNIAPEDNEERTVGAMSTGWTMVYRDNPWLLRWISRGLK